MGALTWQVELGSTQRAGPGELNIELAALINEQRQIVSKRKKR